MIFLKLDYVFTHLSLVFLGEVELEMSCSTYFIRQTCCVNSSSFK